MKVKKLIKILCSLNPEADLLISNFTDNGKEVSYHNIDSVENFSNYQDGKTLYQSENGLVSLNVYDADVPEELEDIDTSGSVVETSSDYMDDSTKMAGEVIDEMFEEANKRSQKTKNEEKQ